MKKFALLFAIVALVVAIVALVFSVNSASAAEEKAKESRFEFSASYDILSSYLGGLSGIEFYKGATNQFGITGLDKKTGLYGFALVFHPFTAEWDTKNPGTEFDVGVGYVRDFGPVKLDAYYVFYDCASLGTFGKGDVHAVGFKLDWALNKFLAPYLTAEFNKPVQSDETEKDGVFYKAGAKINLHQHIRLDLSVAGHSEIYSYRSEPVSFTRAALSFPFEWKGFSITPEISHQVRLGYSLEDRGANEDKTLYALRMAYTF